MSFNMSIKSNLNRIKSSLPQEVTLVAVTKTKPILDIEEAYDTGHRIFGENKIQELVEKHEQLPKDIEWHMIGHVQRNKVKYMASFVALIHGVESLKLLQEINKQAQKYDRTISCLLQIKIASEDSKFGMSLQEALSILNSDDLSELNNISIVGVMGMATFTDDKMKIKNEFEFLKYSFDTMRSIKSSNVNLEIISMGMSNDYELAIDCGSTMVRIGSSIFGARN
jgi:pyridoxal phosphate enzyme (YggS family)